MNDLLICIVVFNENPERLNRTLAHIKSTNYKFEVVVIDNGSSEFSRVEKVCENFGFKFHHSSKNLGFGGGCNLGYSLGSKSRYFLVLNPDLTLRPTTIDQALPFMDKNENIGLVSPKVLNLDGSTQPLLKRNPNFLVLLYRFLPKWICSFQFVKKKIDHFEMRDVNPDEMHEIQFASGCCMFLRSELFEKIKGFDERYFLYFEDADITRSIGGMAETIYNPQLVVEHEWRRANQKKWKYRLIMIHSSMIYFRKWGFQFK